MSKIEIEVSSEMMKSINIIKSKDETMEQFIERAVRGQVISKIRYNKMLGEEGPKAAEW